MAEKKEKKVPQKSSPKFKQFDGEFARANREARHEKYVEREGQKYIKVARGTARAKKRRLKQQVWQQSRAQQAAA